MAYAGSPLYSHKTNASPMLNEELGLHATKKVLSQVKLKLSPSKPQDVADVHLHKAAGCLQIWKLEACFFFFIILHSYPHGRKSSQGTIRCGPDGSAWRTRSGLQPIFCPPLA